VEREIPGVRDTFPIPWEVVDVNVDLDRAVVELRVVVPPFLVVKVAPFSRAIEEDEDGVSGKDALHEAKATSKNTKLP